ncbi:acyl carrier protein [Parvimonas micra]|uniref:acyl carrier protein n=1 Tax=Parvimonas micra TaxID=33033 RepID=UPI0022B74EAB|nr:acyl carrier protein [Parvimonas micra]WBB32613.1 acyl carrier protein [Parvimonas micra]WBB34118.1 acyl carrier protein [Parvimonas micra]WBB35639.1 acyl carrier protein [Parvimonas micra]
MLEKVREILVESLNIEGSEVVPTARLNEDLGIDSLSSIELALEIELEFDIKIEDEELMKLQTVQDVIDIINSKTK